MELRWGEGIRLPRPLTDAIVCLPHFPDAGTACDGGDRRLSSDAVRRILERRLQPAAFLLWRRYGRVRGPRGKALRIRRGPAVEPVSPADDGVVRRQPFAQWRGPGGVAARQRRAPRRQRGARRAALVATRRAHDAWRARGGAHGRARLRVVRAQRGGGRVDRRPLPRAGAVL